MTENPQKKIQIEPGTSPLSAFRVFLATLHFNSREMTSLSWQGHISLIDLSQSHIFGQEPFI